MHSGSRVPWMLAAVLLATVLVAGPVAGQKNFAQKQAQVTQQTNRQQPQSTNTKKVSDSVTNLAQRIAGAIANQKSKTEIFSPVSIAGALSLLLLGSGGKTQTELLNVMGLNPQELSFRDIHLSFGRLFQDLVSNEPSLEPLVTWRLNDKCNRLDDEDDYEDEPNAEAPNKQNDYPADYDPAAHEISLANGIFVQRDYQLSDTYRNESMAYYNSEVQSLDFVQDTISSTKRINEWVSDKTHGKIPNILPSTLPGSTVMVLASAMYFKALWAETFIDGATKPREFYPDGKGKPSVPVDMMAHGGCFPFYESPELDARIIGLPYKNNLTTMYVIMPNDSNRAKLNALIAGLTSDRLNAMIDNMTIKTSIILFPKMHISNTIDLKRTLQLLGLRSMFKPEQSNLSGMTGETTLPDPPMRTVNRVTGLSSLTPDLRPALNMPAYRPVTTTSKVNELQHALIFRVGADESETNATVTEAPSNDTTVPLTTENGESETLVPLTTTPRTGKRALSRRKERDVSYKVPSSKHAQAGPLSSKDFILNKRIVKENGPVGKKSLRRRSKRAAQQLYVSNAVHQVDLEVNETGTEGGAATIVTLNRSGTSIVFRAETPFLLVIRNDRTKLPLFYGAVYHPTS
uniref:Serpin domain-containing protein n=1 Tax=Anopheles dirus TaxID=7168 RepID=A0A182NBI4_9DIPT